MTRFALTASIVLIGTASLDAQQTPFSSDQQRAAEVVHATASAVLRGTLRLFPESLDSDRILERRIAPVVWARLSERQRNALRTVVRDSFHRTLAAPRVPAGEIAWLVPESAGPAARVFLGFRFAGRLVKTRWDLRRSRVGWKIADVVLSDPGLSLADAALDALGPMPVQPRSPARQAFREALPRLLGIAAIALVVLLWKRRIDPGKRVILVLTASAPMFLFFADGLLAVRRALSEPFAIDDTLPRDGWQTPARLARTAERQGRTGPADAYRRAALQAGAPAGLLAYERGLEARSRGDAERSRAAFQEALESRPPAPGAAREISLLALASGDSQRARALLEEYVREAGPDPDSLSALAVARTNVGDRPGAAEAIGGARGLSTAGAERAEIEARVRARVGDAEGAVAALRTLEAAGRPLDRFVLRSDPAYLPIANEPVWIRFLSETKVQTTPLASGGVNAATTPPAVPFPTPRP